MKRVVVCILLTVIATLFTGCFDDGKDYECGYCGEKMSHYYDYIDGEYTCYSCSKVIRN